MTIFDRLLIGTFSAICTVLTGAAIALIPVIVYRGHGTLDFTVPLFQLSLPIAVLIFFIGFFGKIGLVVRLLAWPWKLIESALNQH